MALSDDAVGLRALGGSWSLVLRIVETRRLVRVLLWNLLVVPASHSNCKHLIDRSIDSWLASVPQSLTAHILGE